jgi:hypothetical protein
MPNLNYTFLGIQKFYQLKLLLRLPEHILILQSPLFPTTNKHIKDITFPKYSFRLKFLFTAFKCNIKLHKFLETKCNTWPICS